MARPIATFLSLIPLGLLMAGTAAGQASVEAGLGAARAATTTAPAAGIGKSMSGLAGSLDKAVKGGKTGADGSTTVTTVRVHPTPSASARPAVHWEDPSGIEAGLSYTELVRRFGPPAMEITGEEGTSLSYAGKAGIVQLQVKDGKVALIEKPKS